MVSNGRRPTVVIADDEVHIVDVLAMLFEDYEVEVVKVYNGEQALAEVRDRLPSLLLADIMMPRLSGTEVCERVKADPATAQTTVILMSALPAHAQPPSAADGYLAKPFALHHIEAFASRYFARR
jgi:CheY-like chemotaxis protein